MYLSVVNGENGSMQVLPYEGGFMEQPYRTMQVFEEIRGVFGEKLAEETKTVKRGRK
jgi:hypothetical protein